MGAIWFGARTATFPIPVAAGLKPARNPRFQSGFTIVRPSCGGFETRPYDSTADNASCINRPTNVEQNTIHKGREGGESWDQSSVDARPFGLYPSLLNKARKPACTKWWSPVSASVRPRSVITINEIQSVSDQALSERREWSWRPRSKRSGRAETTSKSGEFRT